MEAAATDCGTVTGRRSAVLCDVDIPFRTGVPTDPSACACVLQDELKALMAIADVDGDGLIDYNEFVAATMHVSKLEKEELLQKVGVLCTRQVMAWRIPCGVTGQTPCRRLAVLWEVLQCTDTCMSGAHAAHAVGLVHACRRSSSWTRTAAAPSALRS
jgi:hypothetical protein